MTTRRGRPSTPAYFIERIRTMAAANIGPVDIHHALEREAAASGGTSSPSLRVVQRERQRFFSLSRIQVDEYNPVTWPSTMESGLLPWEAGPSVMELISAYHSEGRGRPSVRVARWYWRVRGLWGDAPADSIDLQSCRIISRALATIEVSMGEAAQNERTALELAIVFKPWQSSSQATQYQAACSREAVSLVTLLG